MHGATVLLVDDHPLFRDGFAGMAAVLRPAWRLGFASSAAEALQAIEAQAPDLVVIDIVLPGGDGFALAQGIAATRPDLPCALISGREDLAARARARTCGARGFIAKAAAPEEIVAAIDRVLGGDSAFDGPLPASSVSVALSQRQSEVLSLLAEGHGNKEIRHQLGIAERTVRAHLTDLFHILGAHSRMQAVVRAREIGLIP
jgi:DNA-binding NarL/FixJ family response regulator